MRWFALVVLPLFLLPPVVEAHSPDQPPFIQINDKSAAIYPVGSTTLEAIILPQDIAPEQYLINQSVQFELITDNLPFAPEIVPTLRFEWKFGDGTTSTLASPQHRYTKAGSMLVELTSIDPSERVEPQLLDTILVNILPEAHYKMPSSTIQVEGKRSKNPYTDVLKPDFTKPVHFEALEAAANTPGATYLWDFGDQNSAKGVKMTHHYSTQWSSAQVMLRVTDGQGFFTDSMVQLENPNPIADSVSKSGKGSLTGLNTISVLGIMGGLGASLLIVLMVRKHFS